MDPNADFGKAKHRWPFFREQLAGIFHELDVYTADRNQPLEKCVELALANSPDALLILGDDTTLHIAGNKLLERTKKPRSLPPIGLLPSSPFSMGFYASLVPASAKWTELSRLKRTVEVIRRGKTQLVDVGIADFVGAKGKREQRYFFTAASFGIADQILELLPASDTVVHSGLSFITATAKAMLQYRAVHMRADCDGKRVFPGKNQIDSRVLNVFVANGAFGRARMRFLPSARLNDGQLHLVLLPYGSRSELLLEIPKLWFRNSADSAFPNFSGKVIQLHSDPEAPRPRSKIDLDGVAYGSLPAKFTSAPKKLNIFS